MATKRKRQLDIGNVRLKLTTLHRARYQRVRSDFGALEDAETRLAPAGDAAAPIARDLFCGLYDQTVGADEATEEKPVRRIVDWMMGELEKLPEWQGLRSQSRSNVVTAALAAECLSGHIAGLDWPTPPPPPPPNASKQQKQQHAKAQQDYEDALGEMADKLTQDPMAGMHLRGKAGPGIRRAKQQAKDAEEGLALCYGLEGTHERLKDLDKDALALANKMRQLPDLQSFLRDIGRFLESMTTSRIRERVHGDVIPYDISSCKNFARLLPAELAALATPATRAIQTVRIVSGQALGWRMSDLGSKGRGPIHIALDMSGSMSGEEQTAKAFAVASGLHAADNGRQVSASVFTTECRAVTSSLATPDDKAAFITDMLTIQAGGGTDFKPLVKHIKTLGNADDVLLISDGQGDLDVEETHKVFEHRALHYLVIGSPDNADETLVKLAGKRMITAENLMSGEAIEFARQAGAATEGGE